MRPALDAALAALGVVTVYGPSPRGGGLACDDESVARLLARAHGVVTGRPAAWQSASGEVTIGWSLPASVVEVASPADLEPALSGAPITRHSWDPHARSAITLRFGFDPTAPVVPIAAPPAPDRWREPSAEAVAAVAAARRIVVLAGPGVVHDRAVPGLHAFAAAAGAGVLNTWGAKGVFDWRSRHHLATAGLQADDFVLGGLAEADLIVATGLDPLESPPERWQSLAPVVEVEPGALARLSEHAPPSSAPIDVPPLRTRLAEVTQAGWAAAPSPLAPTAVTRHYAQRLPAGSIVAADPGVAGFFVARTFATTELGSVSVAADADSRGLAAAVAVVAAHLRPGRIGLAVLDGPADEVTESLVALGPPVVVDEWSPGTGGDGARHAVALADAVTSGATTRLSSEVDPAWLDRFVDAAGPVVAWT